MRSHDYTREIGLSSTERPVPLPVTIAVLALVAISGVLFVKQVYAHQPVADAAPAPARVSSR